MEYAYFDGFFKGNSKEMVESLAKLKKFFDANVLMEFALPPESLALQGGEEVSSNNTSVFARKSQYL